MNVNNIKIVLCSAFPWYFTLLATFLTNNNKIIKCICAATPPATYSTFILQEEYITLIKRDSKDYYIITKKQKYFK